MGIPQLLQNLEKIEKPKTKVYPKPSSSGDGAPYRPAAVIDGSALAHHIFNRYLKSLSKDERIPKVLGFDYSIYQKNVLNWLERLEVGFRIANIFIDGHLPSYKTSTRTSRIQTTISNLSRLRTLSPSLIDLTKVNWNPSPPFLIAAFSAAVKGHERFKDVIKTVAGEADAFCAAAAKAWKGGDRELMSVIFTGDSDLVVYPSASHTRVAMLDDVRFENDPIEGNKVKVVLWAPWDIERKLGGGSEEKEGMIMKFAWCIVLKDTFRAAKVVASGKGDILDKVTVGREFKEQYLLPDLERQDGEVELDGMLDSRAAEVVYASPRYRRLCHPPVGEKEDGVEVYLPVLLEDVTKSSAWSVGRETRRRAYRILFGNNATVVEVHRKGEAVNKSFVKSEKGDEGLRTGEDVGQGLNGFVIGIILEVVGDYLEKSIPITDIDVLALLAAVTTHPGISEASLPDVAASHWIWPRAHILSQLTAGIWSLYLLQTVASLPSLEVPSDTDEQFLTKLKGFPSLLEVIDTTRFMTIYAISPDRRGMSKNAKKRARKRAKVMEGQDTTGVSVQGIINRMFNRDVRPEVAAVLNAVGDMRRRVDEEDVEEEGEEGMDSYMGMTVG
ncbi:hypothetical protein TWF281_004722 [Arthrobotrys megalospora]